MSVLLCPATASMLVRLNALKGPVSSDGVEGGLEQEDPKMPPFLSSQSHPTKNKGQSKTTFINVSTDYLKYNNIWHNLNTDKAMMKVIYFPIKTTL
ncbi:hypothetical protein [Enterovibrio norvegicus]|uniref:hypothetical protein n=1 Tax=Enterovibrio norvegicus TaxID=188144 RepID=UPI001056C591|nr:hypothetical protein [Enterovibrio norvegicus]